MCESVIEEHTYIFLMTFQTNLRRRICAKRAVETRPTLFFEDVPDYFVTPKILEFCKNATAEKEKEEEDYQDRVQKLKIMICIVEYMNRKGKKAKIKEELLPIAWHPDRVIDWCFSEDEKQDLEKLWKT